MWDSNLRSTGHYDRKVGTTASYPGNGERMSGSNMNMVTDPKRISGYLGGEEDYGYVIKRKIRKSV